jgi:PAS domain S-box-containing protein
VSARLDRRELERQLERRTRELEESQSRFRNIIHRATDAIVVVGSDGLVRFVNPAAEALFGRTAAELVGEEFGVPLIGEDTAELDIVRRDRTEPIVAELRSAETQWNGESAQLVSLRDVTDRKKAEQRAHRLLLEQASRERAEEAMRRSRFLSEASAALDASLDLDTTLTELARLMVPRLGDWCVIDLTADRTTKRVANVHARPELQPLLERVAQSSDGVTTRLRANAVQVVRGLDGARLRELARDDAEAELLIQLDTHSIVVAPLQSRQHRLGALMIVCGERDFDDADVALVEEVAARAGRAIENAQLYRAALAASRAKSDFLAIVSHELRTPLNAIMGYTEMLTTGLSGTLSDEQQARLRRIDASARHLLQLIEEILAHAGLESGRDEARPREFRLSELVDGVTAVAEPLMREQNLAFRLEITDRNATLFTDPGKARQIILNLLSNAAKFAADGTVTLRARVQAGQLVVEVSDTGIGIAPEHHERIFEPFWQVEQPLTRHIGGTGLGLSVSRRLAEMLGGTITVHSEPGAGSTFTLRLPVRYDSVNAPRESRSQ